MMKWIKKGFICDHNTFDLSWFKKNTMTPLPYRYNENTIRLYLTFCDEANEGRVGYIDLAINDPSKIIGYSKEPVLDIGGLGMFDEHGVLPTSLLQENDKLYMYYSAYQKQVSVPYTIFSGLAVSEDGGDSFKRVSIVPILDRTDKELFQRSAIEVLKIGDTYKMWYTSGNRWTKNHIKIVPEYDLKYMESKDPVKWNDIKPQLSIPLDEDEYGLTMPQVLFEDGIYKMFYSIRSFSKGYRLGYAESTDGIHFKRLDCLMDIDASSAGFDSEMVCFGKIFRTPSKTYLFYCGNHYGIGGLGYAELEEKK